MITPAESECLKAAGIARDWIHVTLQVINVPRSKKRTHPAAQIAYKIHLESPPFTTANSEQVPLASIDRFRHFHLELYGIPAELEGIHQASRPSRIGTPLGAKMHVPHCGTFILCYYRIYAAGAARPYLEWKNGRISIIGITDETPDAAISGLANARSLARAFFQWQRRNLATLGRRPKTEDQKEAKTRNFLKRWRKTLLGAVAEALTLSNKRPLPKRLWPKQMDLAIEMFPRSKSPRPMLSKRLKECGLTFRSEVEREISLHRIDPGPSSKAAGESRPGRLC
jgi:hypothetical protein